MSDENPNQSNNFKIINVSCSLSNIAIDTTLALSAFFSTGTSWYQPEKKMFELTDDATEFIKKQQHRTFSRSLF